MIVSEGPARSEGSGEREIIRHAYLLANLLQMEVTSLLIHFDQPWERLPISDSLCFRKIRILLASVSWQEEAKYARFLPW
jgi:hypothetical protein